MDVTDYPKTLNEIAELAALKYGSDPQQLQRALLAMTIDPAVVAVAVGAKAFPADCQRVVAKTRFSKRNAEAIAEEYLHGKRDVPAGLTINLKRRSEACS